MRLSRAVTERNRHDLIEAVRTAPLGTHVEIVTDPRSISQNRLMWLLLNNFANQLPHPQTGEYLDPDTWKCVLMKAFGKELQYVAELDGPGIVAIGYRSSKLDTHEMSNFLEFIYSEGAKRGIRFHGEAA